MTQTQRVVLPPRQTSIVWKNGPMKFNKERCIVLPLRRKNFMHWYTLGDTQQGRSSAEKDLRVLVDTKMNMSQHFTVVAKKVNRIQVCIRRGIASRLMERTFSLHLPPVKPHIEYCVQFCTQQCKRDLDILEIHQ